MDVWILICYGSFLGMMFCFVNAIRRMKISVSHEK